MDYFQSTFYPYRVAGKGWSSFPEVQLLIREVILSAGEISIPKSALLYSDQDLDYDYPITLSVEKGKKKYTIKKDCSLAIIDDQNVLQTLKPILKKYGFKNLQLSDVQIMFKDTGLIGYVAPDKRIVFLNSKDFLKV